MERLKVVFIWVNLKKINIKVIMDRDLKLDSKYNIISRVVELEKRILELEKLMKRKDEVCPKCQSIITDEDGICWKCHINSNK